MNINELQLGNLVYMDKITKFPMKVVGLFEDMVYLDFEGNEGDRFEVKAELVEPIPITAEILEKNGFEKLRGDIRRDYEVESTWENFDCGQQGIAVEKYPNDDNMAFGYGSCLWNGANIQYLHQLQNAMRMVGIEWKVKL